jgi:hypothetical protein
MRPTLAIKDAILAPLHKKQQFGFSETQEV